MRSLGRLVFTFSSLAAITAGNRILFYNQERCDSEFRGCDKIGAATCCISSVGNRAVLISKAPLDVAIGWFENFNTDNYCGVNACSAGGEGNLCCLADLAEYTGASFYTIGSKMSRASAEEQKCTSSQEVNVFGVTIGDGQHLMIGQNEAKARSASFTELHEAFQKVAPADAEAWLLQNGAVVVSDAGPITQTVKVVSNLLSYFADR